MKEEIEDPREWAGSTLPGVYVFFGRGGQVRWIGSATWALGKRISHWLRWTKAGVEIGPEEYRERIGPVTDVVTISLPADRWWEALSIEAFLISKLRPPGNRRGKRTRP